MSGAQLDPRLAASEADELAEDEPTKLPVMAWVSLIGFAAFVVAFGTCAANWMFN